MKAKVQYITVAPTVDTSAYASGDFMGAAAAEFSLDTSIFEGDYILDSVVLQDLAKQSADIDIILFDSEPSGTTFTDNAALDVADADVAKIIGVAPIRNYYAFNDNSVAAETNLNIPLRNQVNSATSTIYGALVSRGSPTYAAATDISIRFGFVPIVAG